MGFIKIEKDDVCIQYNDEEENMRISKNNEIIFEGNYWDFRRNPNSISDFLNKLGITTCVKNNLESIG